mgnify:CR=1 FL=1
MKRQLFVLLLTSAIHFSNYAQTVTKSSTGFVPGASCPEIGIQYQVSRPAGFATCQIFWTVSGGVIPGPRNNPTVIVFWNDTPGATGTVTANFSNCGAGNEGNNGRTASLSEPILSVKNQAWDAYGGFVNVDFCVRSQVLINMPRMFVQGTGGVGQPPRVEVSYAWNVPAGWRDIVTGRTGSVNSSSNILVIEPIGCAVPGTVRVFGTLAGAGPFCNSSAPSATATVSLNGANPVATIGPQAGFAGITACNNTPVTFFASTSVALGCISSYSWQYPPSWQFVSQNANGITLRPSGVPNDSQDIRATINFSCGTSIVSAPYNAPYTNPIISGPDLICNAGTFSVQNANAATVSWSTSNMGILTINQSGVASRITTQRGSARVTATFNCPAPPVSKDIWVGTPAITTQIAYVLGSYGVNPITLNRMATYNFQMEPVPGATFYNWQASSGFERVINDNGFTSAYFTTPYDDGVYSVSCAAENACGSGGAAGVTVVIDSGGGGGGVILSLSPNPVSDKLHLRWKRDRTGAKSNSSSVTNETVHYALFDDSGTEVLRTSTQLVEHTLDVGRLKKGNYVLIGTCAGKTEKARVLVQ